jgi:hypothetical protein
MPVVVRAATVAWLLATAPVAGQAGQTPGPPDDLSTLKNFLPLTPPAGAAGAKPADLSGTWLVTTPPYQSISMADRGGARRGKEPDIDYKPWALARTLAQVPPTGPEAEPQRTTDPWIRYCEPNGPVRIYAHPSRTVFVQLPDRVIVLHEMMQQFRIVRLNATHPSFDDLDPTVWGDAIGWYENGDTFVIDTIGVNGRAWLDQMGHPTTERLHVFERYTRKGNTLVVQRTIDDPGAYNKPIVHTLELRQSTVPFMQSPWNCSVRDNAAFTDNLLIDAAPAQ